jgi:general nucleoside transport system ATP-binding protein
MSSDSALIEFRNVSKYFGTCWANTRVSFTVQPGTIHAIVGENGAGKSTIMKTLFGLYTPDEGQVFLRGEAVNLSSPAVAKSCGIGMVHQHFMLAGPLTAVDHIIIEIPTSSLKAGDLAPLPRAQLRSQLEQLSNSLQMPVPWDEPVENLPVGIQQRIEILKLLYNNYDILILDEPTAVLTPQEIQDFLARLKKIREQGKTILLITHKLKEVFAVADNITVFRKGRAVKSGPTSSWTPQTLSDDMIGEPFIELDIKPSSFVSESLPALKFKNPQINFTVKKGEIVGIAGVEGNGQSELIQAIMNPRASSMNLSSISVYGAETSNLTNLEVRKVGVGYLPEDRHSKGTSLTASLLDNYLLGQQYRFQKNGILNFSALRENFKVEAKAFDIQFQNEDQLLSELSGGNQQKLVVARELSCPLQCLIAAHPTRGVDIQAIKKIHHSLLQARDRGTGILLISSELDELMKLSDRILVLYRNEIIREFSRDQFDEKTIGAAMGGVAS